MKVYRIKHILSGEYVNSTFSDGRSFRSKIGKVYTKKCQNFHYYENHPDYEILWDEIKD